jgi:hypothetical protein
MTKHKKTDPAETMQDLVNTKKEHTQQTPAWPGAKERAEPQHARSQPSSDEAAPRDIEKTPPSESGYERSDVGKRHH